MFVEMGFNRCRLALQAEREKALSRATPNPAMAVEKTSLAAQPVSSDDSTATTPFFETPTEVPILPAHKDDKGKEKKTAPSGLRGKRGLKGDKVESQRKRAAPSSRLPTVAESGETTALVVHTP